MSYAIWSNAVLGERRRWMLGWTAVLLSLFVLVLLFFLAFGPVEPRMAIIGCAIPLATLAMLYWLSYVPGAVGQNSPANARLVPGLHRAVCRTTVLAWCLTLAPLALFASAFEHAALMFVALGALVTSIGMARGGRTIGDAIFILVIVAMAFVAGGPAQVVWLSSAPVLTGLYLLGAALAWEGLRTVFPSGGERHWKLLPAQENQRVRGDLHQTLRRDRASGARARLYAALLRRDLCPAARPEHLLLHALGPGNHRFDFVMPLLLVLFVAVAAKLALTALGLGAAKIPLELICIFAATLIPMQGPYLHRLVVSMNNTRGEQALVRMAPRAPRADRLGRVLARQMLRLGLFEWLACAAGTLALILLYGGGIKELVMLATLQCASLAMTGWTLRDYSGHKHGASLIEVIVQTVLMAAGGVALFLIRGNLAAWSALLVLMLGAAYAIVHGRWKTMVDAPAPFPAGRAY